ncbi:DnaT-like ssDNA-binding domain-containing protein [Aestuariibacter sp. AA17]|uniref:DnaT-like ssDNA-binding domain-containing protein n=1 Tax=Fluctibacter corallii TaxID=2984329 RepID=A0ABT3AD09_9ALTE|nr:DnaT-like ssDNA-binding domain-containing protein [Aestuariibacter sp. AA17]MCV2886528.1 DnaT-like ssDNA-binding domain-containing protein [Aestuariibacter sp. AA17]
MNQSELNALYRPISNDARVLYLLGLRPYAKKISGQSQPLNYKQLIELLNGQKPTYTLGRQVNQLIQELIDVGLLAVPDTQSLDTSFNGKQLLLPLLSGDPNDYTAMHMDWQNMHPDWVPTPSLFEDIAQLVGIIDKHYEAAELGDFIAYWMGRPQMQFSQYQWTQKFVFHIKNKRQSGVVKHTNIAGTQHYTPQAGLEVDDNARKLVEKYSKK